MKKEQVDGLSLASFTLAPDNPTGVAQHRGCLSDESTAYRLGGASGVVGLRQ
ncbi:hypothetical protein [Arthrobacter sp. efr-133-TYG-120]|uniref:hypothetical protein n=1 Tax=Arthrobacter sp. efr-133-TYG-120 TaxID=3040280 RepID=UPI002551A8BF|nr:hypothetical protein [Arthrobacter sp. efr-133-TYG-120]